MKFYEAKVGYKTSDPETNKDVKVKETYIIDAADYGDAEKQTYELLEQIHADDPSVKGINEISLLDILNTGDDNTTDDGGKWFKVKVSMTDPETEKKKRGFVMVKAGNIESAVSHVVKTYNGSMDDYVPEAVNVTNVFIVKTIETSK